MKIVTPHNETIILGTRWGHMIALTCDPFQTSSLGLYGEWARDESDAMCSFLNPGDVAIDVGANIGTMTLGMAKKVGPTGLVLAFEPQRAPFMCLCGNVALASTINHVRCFQAAVGEAEGSISVPVIPLNQQFNMGGVRLQDPEYDKFVSAARREEVPMMTIDGLELPRVKLIKIDVEAMESKVLAGASETVKRCHPVIFAEALYPDAFVVGSKVESDNLAAMLAFFKAHDYEPRFLITGLYSANNNRYCPDNIFPGGDRNIVAIHKDDTKPGWWLKLEEAK